MYSKVFITEGLDKAKPLFFDTETLGFYGKTRLVQVRQDNVAYEYDCFYCNIEEIKHFLKDFHLVGHNIHYDLNCIDFRRWLPKKIDDTLLMARLSLPDLESFSLKSLSEYFNLQEKTEEGSSDWSNYALTEEQKEYAANDTLIVKQLFDLIATNELLNSYPYKLDIRSLAYSCIYSHRGLPLNRQNMLKLIRESKKVIEKSILPPDLNVNSFKQVREYLNVDNSSFEFLQQLNTPEADAIIEKRQAFKNLAFLENLVNYQFAYSIFNPNGAKTGRFTSKGTNELEPNYVNLQQIPGKLAAAYSVSHKDEYFVYCDYPALEIWCAAAIWADRFQVKALLEKADLHRRTASSMFNIPESEVTDDKRQIAKGCNFSLMYGAGAKRFAEIFINTKNYEAAKNATELRQKWLQVYSDIAEVQQEQFSYFKHNTYRLVKTASGRQLRANSPTEALNFQVQGTGAECTKLSLLLLQSRGITVTATVHDSISIVAQSLKEAEELKETLAYCMNEGYARTIRNCKENSLRLSVEVKIGETYNGKHIN